VYISDVAGIVEETKPTFDVAVFGDKGKIQMRLDRSLLGDGDISQWGYAVAVMSQEGFPSSGVRRIRDVEENAQQWRFGGAPFDINHTRIIDVAWATPGEQESFLANYVPILEAGEELGPDDFGVLPLLIAG